MSRSRGTTIEADASTLVNVAAATGAEALELRDRTLTEAREVPLPEQSMLKGLRIRVSVDGGRARTRKKRKYARKGKNGRRPFALYWRSPEVTWAFGSDVDAGSADACPPEQRSGSGARAP